MSKVNRRELFFLGLGGFIAAVPFATRRPLSLVRRTVVVMGTLAEIAVAHREPQQAQAAIDAAVRSLQWVDKTMTAFSSHSDVGRANLRAVKSAVAVTPETMTVLRRAQAWAEASDGIFDPCLGRAVSVWDVKHRHEPPAAPEVTRLANRKLYRQLELAERQKMPIVRFHDPDVSIDLGGIAKGYGVDRAVAALREHGIEHALVGAGGDIYALGRSPSGDAWDIGIQSPFEKDAVIETLRLENAAVATSGDYQQYFQHGGRRYHHLLDPVTGEPRQTTQHSVSIIADTCMDADAAATLAFGRASADVSRALARHGARVAHLV